MALSLAPNTVKFKIKFNFKSVSWWEILLDYWRDVGEVLGPNLSLTTKVYNSLNRCAVHLVSLESAFQRIDMRRWNIHFSIISIWTKTHVALQLQFVSTTSSTRGVQIQYVWFTHHFRCRGFGQVQGHQRLEFHTFWNCGHDLLAIRKSLKRKPPKPVTVHPTIIHYNQHSCKHTDEVFANKGQVWKE